MAMVLADGSQRPEGWGAAACVAPRTQHLNPHPELITLMFDEQVGPATAEAFAVLSGLRLLRRSNTDERYFGFLIVDRPACFANLCELLNGSPREWKEAHYERALETILNDAQRAADDRQLQMIVHLVSRKKAAEMIGNSQHMVHNWMPHRLLERAFQQAQTARRNRDDGDLAHAFHDTARRNWIIEVVTYSQGQELKFRVSPNPWRLPPRPDRPAPRVEDAGQAD